MTSIKHYEFKVRSKKDAEFQSLHQISFHVAAVLLSGYLVRPTEHTVPFLGIKKHFNFIS